MNTLTSTPREDGYHMPGEFEPHSGCWIIWPERQDNWRLGAKPAQAAFAGVTRIISRFEPVTVCVSASQYRNARNALPERVRVVEMSSDDAWVRDTGATFVVNNGQVRGVDWCFNAWGGLSRGLYFPWDRDDMVAMKMCDIERAPRYRVDDFVLEGGAFHTDGQGTVVVTEECLMSRNPHMEKSAQEDILKNYLGVNKVIWLKRGIYGDETGGHVDNVFSFVQPAEAVLAWTDDTSDPQHEISAECLDILNSCTDAMGRKIKIHKLHMPAPMFMTDEESMYIDRSESVLPRNPGDRLPASYVNYYTANGCVVFPTFGDPMDERARVLLGKLYPERKVVGAYSREIILGGGGIHCITQQQP